MFRKWIFLALAAVLVLPAVFAEADKLVYTRTVLTYDCTDAQTTFAPEIAIRTRDSRGRAYLKMWFRFKADADMAGGAEDFRVKFLPSWTSAYGDTFTESLPFITPGIAAPVYTSFVVDSLGTKMVELVPNDIPAQSGVHLFPPYLVLMIAEGYKGGTVQVDYSALYDD